MIIFWKIANRMMTGRTHITAAARMGPWSDANVVPLFMIVIACGRFTQTDEPVMKM